jgi:non-canonical (house-cleaning) NTP pyrophosphatase
MDETLEAGIFTQKADAVEFDTCMVISAAETEGTRATVEMAQAPTLAARRVTHRSPDLG